MKKIDSFDSISIIGYSGHAYVVVDIFKSQNQIVENYCDTKKNSDNPFQLNYLGSENEEQVVDQLKRHQWFIAIGNNKIRKVIFTKLIDKGLQLPINAIHKTATIGSNIELGRGVMIAANVCINACSTIGDGVICNTGAIIEHECKIGNFAHIAPGAVLAGNVHVGEGSFVGANSVVKQGINIGKHVTIGAGTVVIKDIPDNVTIVGNPQRIIQS